MGRPFVQLHAEGTEPAAPWTELAGADGTAHAALLSADPVSGALTRRVRLAPGWTAPRLRAAADCELFVLDGSVRIGDYRLSTYSYSFVPAGYAVGPFRAETPCDLLLMTTGPLEATPAESHAPGTPETAFVPCLDLHAISWSAPITPGFPTGAMRKSLRNDPVTGAQTWILGILPGHRDMRFEVHPVSEEGYQLIGSITMSEGPFPPGSYFWRPPHIAHGRFVTLSGSLTLFRTDGPLSTTYVLDRDPPGWIEPSS